MIPLLVGVVVAASAGTTGVVLGKAAACNPSDRKDVVAGASLSAGLCCFAMAAGVEFETALKVARVAHSLVDIPAAELAPDGLLDFLGNLA
jgi:hypothetical protein